ncbi:hypothetical protein TgHK011_004063 [Trichoderma gracile]|nr:hypothetical protein TgHK011_004063 [Trichoderma gracile]
MPRRPPRAPRARGPYNLGPFEKPGKPYRMSHIEKWEKYGVGGSDLLWGSYWERFNTVQMPIFGETEYFNYALEIAKLAKGSKEEFERIYTQRNKERLGEFLELLEKADNRAFWKHEEFPCEDASDKICAVCQTGALEDFARLLRGITFGWEADIVHDVQPDNHLSESEEDAQSSNVFRGSDYAYWIYEQEERAEWNDPKFREQYAAEMAACVTPLGVFSFQPSTGAAFQPFAGATSKDTAEPTESTPYTTADEGPSTQKQPPLLTGDASPAGELEEKRDDNVENQTQRSPNVDHRERRGLNPETSATPSVSYTEGIPDSEVSGRGPGRDAGVHECKLQQQQGAAALLPDSCGSSLSQKPQNGGAAMKRARPDDESDQKHADDASENNQRRRKLQRLATLGVKDKLKPLGNKRGCRYRAKEKCSSPPLQRAQPPPSGATNTRSSRRNATSSLEFEGRSRAGCSAFKRAVLLSVMLSSIRGVVVLVPVGLGAATES